MRPADRAKLGYAMPAFAATGIDAAVANLINGLRINVGPSAREVTPARVAAPPK